MVRATTTTARSSPSCASSACASRPGDGGPAGRGAADRQHLRHHRHARGVHARGGRRRRSRRSARRSADSVSKKTTGVIVGEEPGLEAGEGARSSACPILDETGRCSSYWARLARSRSGPARARAQDERDGIAVLDDREDVAVVDVAGERGGAGRRPGLRAHVPARRRLRAAGPRACRSRPATASARANARRTPGRPRRRGGARRARSAVRRSRSESPEPSTSRTPAERHAGLGEQPPRYGGARRGRAAPALDRAELLQERARR